MDYEGFKLKSIIFCNESKLSGSKVPIDWDLNYKYVFFIEDVGSNALTFSKFFKYSDILDSSETIENQLHELIDIKATLPKTLMDSADEKRFDLYDKKVYVTIDNHEYAFNITGIGPQAIKLSIQITYDDIATSNNLFESFLRELTNEIYSDEFDDDEFIKKIDEEWESKIKHEKEVQDNILKEQEEKERKRRELEEFLNS